MAVTLIAWRAGRVVAKFTRTRAGAKLEYAPGVSVGVSLSLPVGVDMGEEMPYSWLSNLLPTNPAVVHDLAERYGVKKSVFALLGKIGEDVPGDVSLLPEGSSAPRSSGSPELLSSAVIAREIARIKNMETSTQVSFGGRFSLGGAQSKFSLTGFSGSWYKTTYNLPSTHIFKPGNEKRFPQIEAAEAAAMNLAALSGVRVAGASTMAFEGETSYVTERFDRYREGANLVRTQIEDIGQIMGFKPMTTYKTSLRSMLQRVREVGLPEEELYVLVRQVIFNVHIGNLDAHVRNYSLMRGRNGLIVSPMYDSIPLVRYGAERTGGALAMPINGKSLPWEVTRGDWVEWANGASLSPERVLSLVDETAGAIRTNVGGVFDNWGLEDTFRRAVLKSSEGLTKG